MLGVLLRAGVRNGLRHGLAGSRAWTVIGIASLGALALRSLSRQPTEVIWRQQIVPGDRFVIELPPRDA